MDYNVFLLSRMREEYLRTGDARGAVTHAVGRTAAVIGTAGAFSRSGRTLYYDGRSFQSLKGGGLKSNYYDVETGEEYWISGPRKDGRDRLYGEAAPVEIDDDVRERYWTEIRGLPSRSGETVANR